MKRPILKAVAPSSGPTGGDNGNLDEAYSLAIAEERRGHDDLYIEVDPVGPMGKYVNLWEDSIGVVVGRRFYEDRNRDDADTTVRTIAPDLIENRTTRALIVQVRSADIKNAMRRAKEREIREYRSAIPANQLRGPQRINTSR